MGRTIKKQFWLNSKEAEALRRNAEKTCLTETALVRLLITGFEPREKPDDAFYESAFRYRKQPESNCRKAEQQWGD